MEQIRSFIAIELPEEVKSGLKKVQEGLKSAHPTCARWVDPYSIHLTLKFLGNTTTAKIAAITQSMSEAAQTVSPFHLEVKGPGAFPNLKRVQVIWIGLSGDLDKLQALQKNIEAKVSPLGFPPENRLFTPHLTLARLRETATPLERQEMGDIIINTKIESDLLIQVNTIHLIKSQLTRGGAIYTRLCSVELKA